MIGSCFTFQIYIMNVENFKKDKSKDKIIKITRIKAIVVPFVYKRNTRSLVCEFRDINHLCRSCCHMLPIVINQTLISATCRQLEEDCTKIVTYKCEEYKA